MSSVSVDTIADLARFVGRSLGTSDWVVIDQRMIDRFADLTGDVNWYHIDRERAARELPGGSTIAHGLLTLSLVPGLSRQIVQIARHGRALNYGFDRVRFPAPVSAGSRLRLEMQVIDAKRHVQGVLLRRRCVMERHGSDRPAMVADMLTLAIERSDG